MKKIILFLILVCCSRGFVCFGQCNFYIKFYNYSNADNVINLLRGPGNTFFAVIDYNDPSDPLYNRAITQLDSLGDTLWVRSSCGSVIKDLQYTIDSNLVALSLTSSYCGDSTIGLNGLKVTKFNLNGDTIWNSVFGVSGINWADALVVLADSTYIVATDNDGQNNIYHLDATGNVMSTGVMPFEYVKDAVQGKDGNIYYCGYAGDGFLNSFVIGKTNEALDTTFWIYGFGTNGGSYGDWFNALYVLPDSNIIVTGRHGTYKINYQTGDSIWKNNIMGVYIWPLKDSTLFINEYIWLNKISLNGDNLWSKYFSINANHWLRLNSIFELDQGCFAVLGERVTSFATTTYEPFFAYFDSLFTFPLNVGIETLQQAYTVTVTPNPVTTQAMVSFANEQQQPVVFTLYDITGKAVQQQQTSGRQITLTNNNMSGLFIYELRFKDGEAVRGKVMMQSY